VEFVSNAYLVNNNKVFQCIIRDISDRKLIEDALRFSDVRYRHLFESAKDGIFFLDPNTGKIIDINPFLVKLLGCKKEILTKKEIWKLDIFKEIIPNEKKFLEIKQKEIVCYPNLTIETETGKTMNVEFTSNMYLEQQHKIIQCFIRENNM
jgi:two-component system CheB/CheR fusion protein